MQKPKNPSGTRDFLPEIVEKRNWITKQIITCFKQFGFEPIETPALENITTLTGKYGEEGDQLLYRVLNTRDLDKRIGDETSVEEGIHQLVKMGLRYDLTVPLARFVVQHQHELQLPFRRYQIQPVWRADRAQKGRYREFWQCDADVVGSDSLINEADLIRIYHQSFERLGLSDYVLRINHRGLLQACADQFGFGSDRFTQYTTIIDKLDKVSRETILAELQQVNPGVTELQMDQLTSHFPLNHKSLTELEELLGSNPGCDVGLSDLRSLLDFVSPETNVQLDLSLARGLDYYTGCIFEAVIPESGIGSISGGGRYDNLTGVFGLKDVSGVGISFGIDRIYDILTDRNKFPQSLEQPHTVLMCHFDEKGMAYCNVHADLLRKENLACLVYPEKKKIKKQLDFANKKNIRWVLLAGDNEMDSSTFLLKDLSTGEQVSVDIKNLGKTIKQRFEQ